MSNLRLSGLASGMDTDAMVQSMMKIERMKVDRVEQNKQIAEWKKESYNDMNKTFANFILNSRKDIGLSNSGATGILTNTTYDKLNYIRKATSSDETKASVSSTSKAINGSYSIKINKLARGASFASENMETTAKKASLVNGMTFQIGTGKIDENNEEIMTTIKVNALEKNGVTQDVTMEDVAKAINAKRNDSGVTAFTNNGRLFLQTAETGKDIGIKLTRVDVDPEASPDVVDASNAGHAFIGELGYIETMGGDNDITNSGANYISSQEAEIEFNGVTLKYNDNNIELNGLNIQLKSQSTELININVDTNVTGIMEKIEKLVADYNELVDKASNAVGEKRYSGFHPLSQEEKKAMHEDDVKLWEEKAKSGMLNRDETINRALQNVRTELYKTVENSGKFKHITELGITTEKYSKGSSGGKLEIDSVKLRQAIIDDAEGVMELLFTGNDAKPDDPKNATKGVFTRVYDKLIDGMKEIVDKSGPGNDADLLRNVRSNMLIDFITKKSSISDLDRQVMDMNKKIDSLNVMLARREDAHYAKFTAMEKYMSQMNSQSNWLMQQFM